MAIVSYPYALDMTPGGVTPVVHVSKYAVDFQIIFTLFARGGTLTIPSGGSAMIRGTKTDGTAYSAACTLSGNTVTVSGDVQMTAAEGDNTFEIVLKTSGGSEVGSANFTLSVELPALDYGTVSDSKLLEIADVAATQAALTQAASNIESAVETFEALADDLRDEWTDIIDDTLTLTGKAADAAKTGEKIRNIKSDFSAVTETTKNINISAVGQYAVDSSGNVVPASNNNYFGMTSKIECESNSTYTVTFFDVTPLNGKYNIFYAFFDVSGAFISRNSTGNLTTNSAPFTTPSNAHHLCCYVYSSGGFTVSNASRIQVESGSVSTDYVPPYNAVDEVARTTVNQHIEHTRNINTTASGRFAVTAEGAIQASNSNHFGMAEKIDCLPDTDYTVSLFDISPTNGYHNIFYAFYSSSGEFLERNSTGNQNRASATVHTPTNTSFIYFTDYSGSGITITDDSKIQIEVGAVSTDYVAPITAVDNVARELATSYVIPGYFKNQLESAVGKIKADMLPVGQNGDSFIFISDCHWYNNQRHSPALINHILKNTNVRMVVNGGDFIQGHETTKAGAIAEILDCVKAFQFEDSSIKPFNIFGNHDDNTNNNTDNVETHLSQSELYSVMLKPFENNDVKYGGYNYYYVDNAACKIRYYFMDWHGGVLTAQAEWVNQTAGNLPIGYDIVVFCHGIYRAQRVDGSYVFTMERQAILDMFEDFQEKIICFVQGHAHMDGVFMAYDGAVPIIITDTDAMNPVGESVTATVGTVTEQCFDVFVINKANRTISCTRVGRGSDREISY